MDTLELLGVLLTVPLACGPADPSGTLSQASDTLRLVRSPISLGAAPSAAVAGDLTGDGQPDLLITNTDDGTVTLLVGDGSGQFPLRKSFPGGENPVDLALGDLDGDGDLDAAVANHETDYVTLLRNDGQGGLEPFSQSPRHLDLGLHPHAVLIADLDLDGHPDLLVDDRRGEAILLLRGAGDGGFDMDVVRFSVGGDPYRGMTLADVNGDGHLDIITPNRDEIAIVLRVDDGGFAAPEGIPADRPFEVRVGDLNGDGVPDLVVATEPGPVRVLSGSGDGTFLSEPIFEQRWAGGAKAVAIGDFDGDGIDDSAVTNWNSHDVLVLFGGSDGVRTARVTGGENPWGITAADLTGDGAAELLVLDNSGDALRVYSAGPVD
jgi:hypothetical protein